MHTSCNTMLYHVMVGCIPVCTEVGIQGDMHAQHTTCVLCMHAHPRGLRIWYSSTYLT